MLEAIVKNYVTDMVADKLASTLGMSPSAARSLVNKAVPLLLGGMANNASQDQNAAASLFKAITKDHDGSIFANLDSLMADPKSAQGDKILQHVFGDQETAIEGALANETGVDQNQAVTAMQTLAPLVMGALGQEQSEKKLEADHLAKMFAEEKRQTHQQAASNPLLAMIDKEGNGVADDLIEMGMSFLKK